MMRGCGPTGPAFKMSSTERDANLAALQSIYAWLVPGDLADPILGS
jgi:hypothetical protein